MIDLIHPVGEIITMHSSTDPNDIWPTTTWVRHAQGKVIVGVDATDSDFNTVGKTGGAKTVPLTPKQLPWNVLFRDNASSGAVGSSDADSSSGTGWRNAANADWSYAGYTSYTTAASAFSKLPPYVTEYQWLRTA